MLTWKRPSGTELETKDTPAIREVAEENDWELISEDVDDDDEADDDVDDDSDNNGEEGAGSYVDSGDQGCGAPGTFSWLKATIKQSTKGKIVELIEEKCQVTLSLKLKRDDLIVEAINTLKETMGDGDS